jgi:type II secretory pathway component PulK
MTRFGHLRDLARRARARLRRPAGRQAGVALVIAMVAVVVLTAITSELAYNTRVEMQMAANAQHELRAHYFAESAIQLGQAAIIIQQMIDRFASLLGGAGAIKVDDLIDLLLPMFNMKEGGGLLGSLLGVDPGAIKGLGVEGGTFDLKVGFEDGKINLNCAGGLDQVTDTPQKKALGAVLAGLFSAQRYRTFFEVPDSEGQRTSPMELTTALVDWVDVDEQLFMSGGGAEDYQYDQRRDKYTARNYFIDTSQELRLARGMGDDAWASFGEYFTAYGPCKVNLAAVNQDHWPLIEGIIRAFASPGDPVAHDERKLEALAQFVTPMLSYLEASSSASGSSTGSGSGSSGSGSGSSSGSTSTTGGGVVDQFVQMVGNPTQGTNTMADTGDGTQVQVEGVKLQATIPELGIDLKNVIGGGKKTVFRLEASGESGPGCMDPKRGLCSRRKITAIFNSNKMGINALQAKQGVWVYWREE